jgi:Golgi phosphoprotein 3 (GPP34)
MLRQPLATAFFLFAHDTFSGKLLISADLLGCGLVGAQMAELILAGRLQMLDGKVAVSEPRGDGSDTISAYVMDSVSRQPQAHAVRTWTENLGPMLTELVARAALDEGIVQRETSGVLRRKADRFPALDLVRAAAGRVRVEHALRHPKDMDLRVGILTALVFAVGADRLLDPGIDRLRARALVAEVGENLPGAIRQLLDGLAAAIAAVSLRVRR